MAQLGFGRRRFATLGALVVIALGLFFVPAAAQTGYRTDKPSQVRTVAPGWSAQPIITVGDTVGNYQMASIPDGLGAFDNGDGTFTLFVNHELTTEGDTRNLSNARVSRLVIDKATLAVRSGEYVIDGSEGYYRLCSATMVGPAEGFPGYLFFTNEESTTSRFGGISLAIDARTGQRTDMPWLGKLAHENTIVAPGFPGKTVVFTTDDSAPGFLYMYVANSPADLMVGRGQLYVLVVDGAVSEADLTKGARATGRFVAVSQDENRDARTLTAAAGSKGATIFARLEDATYDRNDPSAIFFDTTGRSGYNDARGREVNARGKLYRLKLDPADPTRVTELRVLLDGNAGDDILNPDNIEADRDGIMLQEDLNSEFYGNRPGRMLRYDMRSGAVTAIAELDQRDFNGQPIANDRLGAWETSGVIDMSAILGPGTWLIDVQAHSLRTPQFGGVDEGGQLLLVRSGAAPGLPSTGGGGGANRPANTGWLLALPLLLMLATAAGRWRRGRDHG